MNRKSSVDSLFEVSRYSTALHISNGVWDVLAAARAHVLGDEAAARFLLDRMTAHCMNSTWLIYVQELLWAAEDAARVEDAA